MWITQHVVHGSLLGALDWNSGIVAYKHSSTNKLQNIHTLYMNIHIYVSCTEHQLVKQVTNQLQHSKHTSLSPPS